MLDHSPANVPAASLDRVAKAYVEAFRLAGVPRLIANLSTHLEARPIGDRLVPITINNAEPSDTYLCSPYLALMSRTRDDLRLLRPGRRGWPWGGLMGNLRGPMRTAAVDRVVHLNNWLLPTNLASNLKIPYPGTLTRDLAAEFPQHLLALRSLNSWSDATLMAELTEAGWVMVPSRQIWIVEDPETEWAPRPNSALDRAFAARHSFIRDDFAEMSTADSHAVARLYSLLHTEAAPRHDPAYTSAFMRVTHALDMIHYIGLREPADGSLAGVIGVFRVGDMVTPAITGYDPRSANAQSLYRLAFHTLLEAACREGLRVNLSSGTGDFKRRRGASPQVEYTAFYLAHLPKARQRPVLWLKSLLDRAGAPAMRAALA